MRSNEAKIGDTAAIILIDSLTHSLTHSLTYLLTRFYFGCRIFYFLNRNGIPSWNFLGNSIPLPVLLQHSLWWYADLEEARVCIVGYRIFYNESNSFPTFSPIICLGIISIILFVAGRPYPRSRWRDWVKEIYSFMAARNGGHTAGAVGALIRLACSRSEGYKGKYSMSNDVHKGYNL